jgi:hypothetical protein
MLLSPKGRKTEGDGEAAESLRADVSCFCVQCCVLRDAGKENWKIRWWPQAREYLAPGIGDEAGVRLADVNGDGKADWIHLDHDGSMTVFMNLGRRDEKGVGV